MSMMLTLLLMGLTASLFVLCAWCSGRPWNPLKGPRMIPWTLIALLMAVCFLILLAHFFSFYGIETGQRMRLR